MAIAGRSEASPDAAVDLSVQLLACTGCHGPEGRAGPDGYYPRLAGKPAGYLYAQLLHFRDGARSYELMRRLLTPLSDRYLAEIAEHFSRQQVPYSPPTQARLSQDEQARARLLIELGDPARGLKACADCHGDNLMGRAPAVPALLGLSRDYINAQLGAWREGLRQSYAPDCMAHISQQLTTTEVALLSTYLASQRVPLPEPSAATATTATKHNNCSTLPAPRARALTAQDGLTTPGSAGEYLARVGNCAGCHNAPGKTDLAGGKAIVTPFGEVYSSNLTPDRRTGLGSWSSDDFWRAMRDGRSRDGRWLYPAFPYSHYSGITRADADQLFAWLKSLASVEQANKPHRLSWPASTQWALALWRKLYFKPMDWRAEPKESADWNRGAYLAETLGHCGACHTPRNRLGGLVELKSLAGARMSEVGWYAPALRERTGAVTGSKPLAPNEMAQLLSTGISGVHRMSGPMAEIVASSLQYLTPADRDAMAAYLSGSTRSTTATVITDKPVRDHAQPAPVSMSDTKQRPSPGPSNDIASSPGLALYKTHCGDCHGKSGQGRSPGSPALVLHPTLTQRDPTNLINVILYGGFSAATAGNPRPYGMPPLLLELNDRDVATLASFVRGQWGTVAEPIQEHDVRQQRGLKAH